MMKNKYIFCLFGVVFTLSMSCCTKIFEHEKELNLHQIEQFDNPLDLKLFKSLEKELSVQPRGWIDFKRIANSYYLDGEYSLAFSYACAYRLRIDPLFFLRAYSAGDSEALEYAKRGYALLNESQKNHLIEMHKLILNRMTASHSDKISEYIQTISDGV